MERNTTNTKKKYIHLTFAEREEISIGLSTGKRIVEIARAISRDSSTLYREINRNNPKINTVQYRANRAQLRNDERKIASHERKRLNNTSIQKYVVKKLKAEWTPELIAGKLPIDKPGLETNHESIYLWIYNDRRDLIKYLPRAHRTRQKRSSIKNKRCIRVPDRTMIDKRSAHIEARKEAGHWEADTAVSRQSKAAITATVERKSRFLIVKKIKGKTADCMHNALIDSLKALPEKLRKTITYDNGTENANHKRTNDILKTKSYFCNPYHSWEKGSIENRIGMIRRYFPKKTDWSLITQRQIDKVVKKTNTRPMKCLGFKTPEEVFVALRH
jgi:transposase, IS30 family